MFKVDDDPQFTHTVEALVPVDGGHEKQPFKATFRVLDPEDGDGYDLNSTAGSTDFLKRVVVHLDELEGADGKPRPYSDGLRDRLLKLPYVRAALARAYFTAVTKATVGN